MTTITAKFKGNQNDLKMFLFSGVNNYSTKFLGINTLIVTWIFEEKENALENAMNEINMRMSELWNSELISIN